MGRMCEGMPGTVCICRSLQGLDTAVDMYVALNNNCFPGFINFIMEVRPVALL